MKFLLFAVFALVVVSAVSAYGEFDEAYNEVDDDVEQGNRNARQNGAYAYVPPSKSCARVAFGKSFCGGLSRGNNGGCDSYCLERGYPLSYCRPTHCLCHRGEDLGRECEQNRG